MSTDTSRLNVTVLSAVIQGAADRAGWSLPAERAAELAEAARPTLEAFANVHDHIDFDSDPLAFLAVRDDVKHHDER